MFSPIRRITISVLLFLALFFSAPIAIFSQGTTVTPSVGFTGTYNNNYFFDKSSEDTLAVRYLTISPSLAIDRASDRLNLKSLLLVEALRYQDEEQLDDENYLGTLSGQYLLTPRLSFTGNVSYLKDTRISRTGDVPQPIGIISNVPSRRHVFDTALGLGYRLSRLSNIGLNYAYDKSDYALQDLSDSETHSVSLFYSQQLANTQDTVSVQPNYTYFNSEEELNHTYGLSFGYTHQFTTLSSLSLLLGGYQERSKLYNDDNTVDENTDLGGRAGVSFSRKGERFAAAIGYRYDIFPTDAGDLVELHGASADLQITPTKGLSLRLYTLLIWPNDTRRTTGGDTDYANYSNYYEFGPAIGYQFTENVGLQLAGDYTVYQQANRERARAWLTLTFSLPKRF